MIEGLNNSLVRGGLEEEERSKIRHSKFQKWKQSYSFCFVFSDRRNTEGQVHAWWCGDFPSCACWVRRDWDLLHEWKHWSYQFHFQPGLASYSSLSKLSLLPVFEITFYWNGSDSGSHEAAFKVSARTAITWGLAGSGCLASYVTYTVVVKRLWALSQNCSQHGFLQRGMRESAQGRSLTYNLLLC